MKTVNKGKRVLKQALLISAALKYQFNCSNDTRRHSFPTIAMNFHFNVVQTHPPISEPTAFTFESQTRVAL